MSLVIRLLENLIALTEYELDQVEVWLHAKRCGHPFRPAAGRFAGVYFVDPKTGVFIVAQPALKLNTAYTGTLTFVDATGRAGPGPVGSVSSDSPDVSVGLSADGQSYNVTATADLTAPATLTWTDPAGVVASFTTAVATEAEAPFQATSGSFGDLTEGNTP